MSADPNRELSSGGRQGLHGCFRFTRKRTRLEELGVLPRWPWDRCSAPTVLPEAGVDIFGSGWESPESSGSGLSVLRGGEGAMWRAGG